MGACMITSPILTRDSLISDHNAAAGQSASHKTRQEGAETCYTYCVKLLLHVLILRAHTLFSTAFNSATTAIPLPRVGPR